MMHRKGPSFTAISTWGVDHDNNLFWLDLRHFRKEIPEIVDEIKKVYNRYRPAYFCMETNGVGAGPSQYVKRLGIPVKKIKKGVDKLENSLAAGILLRAGKLYLPNNAPWIDTCEDELFSWTGLPQETDDIIDTFSDAANEVGPIDVDINDGPSSIVTKIPIIVHRGVNLSPSLNRKKALPWVSR
jgi:predicted phage terminase large subunit-like protein